MSTVWILGGGLIGAGWAAVFAASGARVVVIDPAPGVAERLAELWPRAFSAMAELGREGAVPPLPQVVASAELAGPAPDWLQENLPENLALKQQTLAALEPLLTPATIIASSSSGLSPDDIGAGLVHPGRVVIVHPCNPSWLMPVVELCCATSAPEGLVERATAMLEGQGKTVLRLNRAMPGHLVNRLQAALWREAVHLAQSGVASLGDIERAVVLGLGPRWSLIGPSTVFHVSGGAAGMQGFLNALGPEFERWWATLGQPALDEDTCRVLIAGMAAADPRPVAEIAATRDAALTKLMVWLEKAGAGDHLKGGETE